MSAFTRWIKFNLVGMMGMAVQLAALALFKRWMPGHYLCATAAAVELTLLHNFTWHLHYTWRDRRQTGSWLKQLARFHLSSGLVSMLGNLMLMRLLMQAAHLPLLAANITAILCCGLMNFWLGNCWAFAGASRKPVIPRRGCVQIFVPALLFAIGGSVAYSQASPSPPDAPAPQSAHQNRPYSNASYFSRAGILCGAGASTSSAAMKPTPGCGAGITLLPLPVFFEAGIMGPQANRSYLSGYISLDTDIALRPRSSRYMPMAMIGYSRLFDTNKSWRIELRDYYTFANPTQHNVMLRIGWMQQAHD
jgi:putative flippase GtrA